MTTYGYLLLEIPSAFGDQGHGRRVMGELATNLLVGLGDTREAAGRTLQVSAERPDAPSGVRDSYG